MSAMGGKVTLVAEPETRAERAMRKAGKVASATFAVGLCIGGATLAGAVNTRNKDRSLPMVIQFTRPANCQINVGGQSFTLPVDEDRMISSMRELRRIWKSAYFIGGQDIPYRCLGHAIFIAQRAGFKGMKFHVQPPD